MFIAALFTTAKACKDYKCPLMDELIKKMWCVCICNIHICICIHIYMCVCIYIYTHTMEYYSAVKEKDIFPFATWVELKGIMPSEMSDIERQTLHSLTINSEILKI